MYAFQLSPLSILKRDENGWQPLHEAVRSGHLNVVKYLIEKGSNINSRTGIHGNGGSVLWWAKKFHDNNHPVVVYLKENNAISIAPEGVNDKDNGDGDDDDDDNQPKDEL